VPTEIPHPLQQAEAATANTGRETCSFPNFIFHFSRQHFILELNLHPIICSDGKISAHYHNQNTLT
jgi:hypothetical protein